MKKILCGLVMLGAAAIGSAQSTPPLRTIMLSSDGGNTFQPDTSSSSVFLGDPTATPPGFVPMCTSTGGPPFSQCSFGGGGGSGTVTSVSGLTPIFSVTNPTTTPIFALSNAAGNTLFGNCTGTSAAPSYCSLTVAMLPTGIPNANLATPFGALSGDATSTSTGGATTVQGINGTRLSGLGTGLLVNTTGTGVPTTLASVNGECALGFAGSWVAGVCPNNIVFPVGLLFGAGATSAPTVATAAQIQTAGLDTRPSIIATTGKTGVLLAGSTTQVFNVASGNAGTITFLHLTMGNVVGGDLPNIIQNSQIEISCDGRMVAVPLGLFLMSQDYPQAFSTGQISVPLSNSSFYDSFSFNRRVNINYYNGCTIALANASPLGDISIYFDTSYRPGTPVGPPSTGYWNAYPTYFPSLAANTGAYNAQQVALLPAITSSGGGQLESIAQWVNSSVNFTTIEATPTVTADSILAATANGGEDFFGCGFYCGDGTNAFHTDKWGILWAVQGLTSTTAGLANPLGTYDSLGYRFFTSTPQDNLIFNSTLQVNTANGDSAVSPGTVNLAGLVTYFTATPTASVAFSPIPATYTASQTVTLTAYPSSGATVCYTTNGATPVVSGVGTCSTGTVYTTPITVSSTETLLAAAQAAGYNNSLALGGIYTIESLYLNTRFTEASSGTNLAGTIPTVCTAGSGCTWTNAGGTDFTYQTGGGVSVSGPTTNPDLINTGQTNEVIRFTLNACAGTGSVYCGFYLRYTNVNNYIAINSYSGANGINIYDGVSGTFTLKGTIPVSAASPNTGSYTVTLNGTSAKVTGPSGASVSFTTANTTGTTFGFLAATGATSMKITALSAASQ